MVGIQVVHIAVSTAHAKVPVKGEVHVLDLAEAAKDLHNMFPGHVPGQPSDVNAKGPWGHRTLPPLLRSVGAR